MGRDGVRGEGDVGGAMTVHIAYVINWVIIAIIVIVVTRKLTEDDRNGIGLGIAFLLDIIMFLFGVLIHIGIKLTLERI